MNTGQTLFAQLTDFLPLHEFRQCVRRYRGDYKMKTFCGALARWTIHWMVQPSRTGHPRFIRHSWAGRALNGTFCGCSCTQAQGGSDGLGASGWLQIPSCF